MNSAIRRNVRGCAAWIFILLLSPLFGSAQTKFTILTNGNSASRLNLTVVSEGYTSTEQGQFFTDATQLVSDLLSAEPYAEYRSYFNASALFVASAESGSDHPAYPQSRQTYFNSTFDVADRLLTIPANQTGLGKVTALINTSAPETDLSILLVNDLVFGGSGGPILITSKNISSSQIVVHESGHTLAGLGDESSDPIPGYPPVEEPNVTRQTNRDLIPWKVWISTNTPVPTPETIEFMDEVGLFEGAHYQTGGGWFRPKLDCGMRHLGVPFCEVCAEALIRAIYKKVRSIESYSPSTTNFSITAADPILFTISPLEPASHKLGIQWFVNGAPVAGETNALFNWSSEFLPKGIHTVTAVVRDLTSLVRNDPDNSLSNSVSWRISKNFPETTAPTISIRSPPAGARFTNSFITVRGIARDNVAVSSVAFQLNGGANEIASGKTNWMANIEMQPGTNLFRCFSTDVSGNVSSTRDRKFFYSVLTPVVLAQNGVGTISGVTNGQLLEIGKSYRVKAKAAPGFLFAGWMTNTLSSLATFTFQMQSNLVLTPTFIPNPFEPNRGTFSGWLTFADTNSESAGLLSLKLAGNGSFSGKVEAREGVWRFSGKFGLNQQTSVLVKRGKNFAPLLLNLELDSETQKITGTASDVTAELLLNADRSISIAIPARYTFVIPGADSAEMPAGEGYGAVVIGAKATARTSGLLADGTRFSYNGPILSGGKTRIFTRLNSGRDLFSTELVISDAQVDSVAFSQWTKTGDVRAKFYPAGFTNGVSVLGERYFVPTANTSALGATNVTLVLQFGGLLEAVTNQVHFDGNVASSAGGEAVALRITPATGLFKGKFKNPSTQRTIAFQGAVLQVSHSGGGFFLGTNQSGRVTLQPIEE